ncbi:MAG: HD-GYP domain-containing protein [Pseudomonadota bacterium]|nr:MAG: HD-GYP domain-containing protein [Pseudomonadota bacterium]
MKIKVNVEQLKTGMYVSELDRPWLGTPFLFQGFAVEDDEQLTQLRELCEFVYVDVEQSVRDIVPHLQKLAAAPQVKKAPKRAPRRAPQAQDGTDHFAFHAELRKARPHYDATRTYIEEALEDVRLGQSVDTKAARRLVGQLADSILRNANALVWLTHLKERDQYTVTHCINVCILTLSFARCLGIGREEMQTAGLGALLHDLGKMRVPLEILNKPGKLTDEEFEIIKTHPVHGYNLLRDKEELTEEVLDIVHYHHERIGGRGYPKGFTGDQISQLTKLVSIVDVYDAVTSDRCYHDGITPHQALNNIYKWAPGNFDQELVESFIRCLGIYPIGSLVELNTGDIGVVVVATERNRLRPMVLLVLDADHKPYSQRTIINLANPKWAEGGEKLEIVHILEGDAYGINVPAIIEDECRQLESA